MSRRIRPIRLYKHRVDDSSVHIVIVEDRIQANLKSGTLENVLDV